MAKRLTKEQARQVRSLIEDSGYTRAEARVLVLAGMGEPRECPVCGPVCDNGFEAARIMQDPALMYDHGGYQAVPVPQPTVETALSSDKVGTEDP